MGALHVRALQALQVIVMHIRVESHGSSKRIRAHIERAMIWSQGTWALVLNTGLSIQQAFW